MAKTAQLQLAFTEADQKRNNLKVAKSQLRQILDDHPEYTKAVEQRQLVTDKLKSILANVKEAYPKLQDEISSIEAELKAEKELITDLAINDLMAGKTVEVADSEGRKYAPVWRVSFKRSDDLFTNKK